MNFDILAEIGNNPYIEVLEEVEEVDTHSPSKHESIAFWNEESDHDKHIIRLIKKSRTIQQESPNRLLCGSLGLLLHNIIKPRYIGDLDFCQYMHQIKQGTYIPLKFNKPHKHCLFLLSKNDEVMTQYIKYGLQTQSPEVMKKWKLKFGRKKDLKDFELENDYFSSEDFLL